MFGNGSLFNNFTLPGSSLSFMIVDSVDMRISALEIKGKECTRRNLGIVEYKPAFLARP